MMKFLFPKNNNTNVLNNDLLQDISLENIGSSVGSLFIILRNLENSYENSQISSQLYSHFLVELLHKLHESSNDNLYKNRLSLMIFQKLGVTLNKSHKSLVLVNNLSFSRFILDSIKLKLLTFTSCDFTGVSFSGAVFCHCKFIGCLFDEVDLSQVSFSNCETKYCSFENISQYGMRGLQIIE